MDHERPAPAPVPPRTESERPPEREYVPYEPKPVLQARLAIDGAALNPENRDIRPPFTAADFSMHNTMSDNLINQRSIEERQQLAGNKTVDTWKNEMVTHFQDERVKNFFENNEKGKRYAELYRDILGIDVNHMTANEAGKLFSLFGGRDGAIKYSDRIIQKYRETNQNGERVRQFSDAELDAFKWMGAVLGTEMSDVITQRTSQLKRAETQEGRQAMADEVNKVVNGAPKFNTPHETTEKPLLQRMWGNGQGIAALPPRPGPDNQPPLANPNAPTPDNNPNPDNNPRPADAEPIILNNEARFAAIISPVNLDHPRINERYRVDNPPATLPQLTGAEVQGLLPDTQLAFYARRPGDPTPFPDGRVIPHLWDLQVEVGAKNATEFPTPSDPRFKEAFEKSRNESTLFALAASSAPTPEDQANLYRSLAHVIVDAYDEQPEIFQNWLRAQGNPDDQNSSIWQFMVNDRRRAAEGVNYQLFPRSVDGLYHPDEQPAIWANRIQQLKEAVQRNGFTRYQDRWLELLSHGLDIQKVMNLIREKAAATTPEPNRNNEPITFREAPVNNEARFAGLDSIAPVNLANPRIRDRYAVDNPPSTDQLGQLSLDETRSIIPQTERVAYVFENGMFRPNPDVIPHVIDLEGNGTEHDARFTAATGLTNGESYLLSLAAASAPDAASQSRLYTDYANVLVQTYDQNPDLFERWLDAQGDPENPESSMRAISFANMQRITNGRSADYILFPHGADGEYHRDEQLVIWRERIRELKQAVERNELTEYHDRWLDLLSQTVDIPAMVKLLRDKQPSAQNPNNGNAGPTPEAQPSSLSPEQTTFGLFKQNQLIERFENISERNLPNREVTSGGSRYEIESSEVENENISVVLLKDKGQDAVGMSLLQDGKINLVVADGVSNTALPELASRDIRNTALEELTNDEPSSDVFKAAYDHLNSQDALALGREYINAQLAYYRQRAEARGINVDNVSLDQDVLAYMAAKQKESLLSSNDISSSTLAIAQYDKANSKLKLGLKGDSRVVLFRQNIQPLIFDNPTNSSQIVFDGTRPYSNQNELFADVDLLPGDVITVMSDGIKTEWIPLIQQELDQRRASGAVDRLDRVLSDIVKDLLGTNDPDDDVSLLAVHHT